MSTEVTKLVTAEEFFDWCHRPENRDRHYELDRGRIVEMSRPGERHGVVCGNTAWELGSFVRRRRKGYVCTNDTGLIIGRDPDSVKGPDVILYDRDRRFDDLNPQYEEDLLDLAAEVLSPNDKFAKVVKRIQQLLRLGIRIVWLLDPEDRTLTVYRLNQFPQVLEADEEVTGEEVFPDLRCRVADFFAMPGQAKN